MQTAAPITLESYLYEAEISRHWHMQASERSAIMHLLEKTKSDISIEIGTFMGGSLRPIAAASRHVYTFDIDDRSFDGLPNVSFIAGNSADTVPPLLEEIGSSEREINFILIDGDHSEDGVRCDIVNCITYKPKTRPTIIVMHDSSNPVVRKGISEAPWADSPYVHEVNLDFIPGVLYDREDLKGQIWGGLATAVLSPNPRQDGLRVIRPFQASLDAMIAKSIYV
jgi:hypothetical protein